MCFALLCKTNFFSPRQSAHLQHNKHFRHLFGRWLRKSLKQNENKGKVFLKLKACVHLIHFNALPKPASEPVSSEAYKCALMHFGASTLFYMHIICCSPRRAVLRRRALQR